MKAIIALFAALSAPALLAADCQNPALRDEILAMVTVDQKARPQPGHMMSEAEVAEMLRVDELDLAFLSVTERIESHGLGLLLLVAALVLLLALRRGVVVTLLAGAAIGVAIALAAGTVAA